MHVCAQLYVFDGPNCLIWVETVETTNHFIQVGEPNSFAIGWNVPHHFCTLEFTPCSIGSVWYHGLYPKIAVPIRKYGKIWSSPPQVFLFLISVLEDVLSEQSPQKSNLRKCKIHTSSPGSVHSVVQIPVSFCHRRNSKNALIGMRWRRTLRID